MWQIWHYSQYKHFINIKCIKYFYEMRFTHTKKILNYWTHENVSIVQQCDKKKKITPACKQWKYAVTSRPIGSELNSIATTKDTALVWTVPVSENKNHTCGIKCIILLWMSLHKKLYIYHLQLLNTWKCVYQATVRREKKKKTPVCEQWKYVVTSTVERIIIWTPADFVNENL